MHRADECAPQPVADLGVLGGMGPRATHYFTDELLSAIEQHHHPERDQDYPSIYVRYACQIPDRTATLATNRKKLLEAVSKEARILVDIGCPKIVMTCITAHALLDSDLSDLPFIDVRQVVAEHIESLLPAATVGILATRGARLAGTINKFLPPSGRAVTLEAREEENLMAFIYGAAKTWSQGNDISSVNSLADRLRQRGCDAIVAGCTEIEMCLARYESTKADIIMPLKTVANSFAVTWTATLR